VTGSQVIISWLMSSCHKKDIFLSLLMSSCHNKDILNNVNFALKVSSFTKCS